MAAAARRYPFEAVWNREVFAAVANAVTLPVFAVGGIRTVDEANEILGSSSACMVGVGRPFYTEPDLPRRWLQASDGASVRAACESCNLCIVPQMLGLPGVCYNPSVQRANSSHAAE
jgi:2,4-dienoyl-CoA reductase-like NADH-dependent reductase (Old Yellow Enzyme family)